MKEFEEKDICDNCGGYHPCDCEERQTLKEKLKAKSFKTWCDPHNPNSKGLSVVSLDTALKICNEAVEEQNELLQIEIGRREIIGNGQLGDKRNTKRQYWKGYRDCAREMESVLKSLIEAQDG